MRRLLDVDEGRQTINMSWGRDTTSRQEHLRRPKTTMKDRGSVDCSWGAVKGNYRKVLQQPWCLTSPLYNKTLKNRFFLLYESTKDPSTATTQAARTPRIN